MQQEKEICSGQVVLEVSVRKSKDNSSRHSMEFRRDAYIDDLKNMIMISSCLLKLQV